MGHRLLRVLLSGARQPIGFKVLDGYQLKILQEIITLVVFVIFAKLVLGEDLKWNYMVSFLFLGGAAYFAFAFKSS